MHARQAHNHRSPLLIAVHGTHRLACLKEFHATSRLIQHMGNNPKCFQQVAEHAPAPMDAEWHQVLLVQRQQLAKQARNSVCKPIACRLPSLRLEGPLQHWAAS